MTTVILLRLPPPCLSSHWSYFRRPSMKMGLPLVKYWLITSACFPKEVQSTNVTSSLSSPLAVLKRRLQATPNSTTAVWLGRYFICGSRVRLPIRMTLLKLAMEDLRSRIWNLKSQIPNFGFENGGQQKTTHHLRRSVTENPPYSLFAPASAAGASSRRRGGPASRGRSPSRGRSSRGRSPSRGPRSSLRG